MSGTLNHGTKTFKRKLFFFFFLVGGWTVPVMYWYVLVYILTTLLFCFYLKVSQSSKIYVQPQSKQIHSLLLMLCISVLIKILHLSILAFIFSQLSLCLLVIFAFAHWPLCHIWLPRSRFHVVSHKLFSKYCPFTV